MPWADPPSLSHLFPFLGHRYTFNDWSKTSWDKIDVEFLMDESKKLTKDIKTINKAVRNYEVFRLLEEALKGMLTSLPLVQV